MASRLPLPVVVMVMASLLALLLQSASASVAVEPHIEMVVNNSSSNNICHYELTVRTSGWVLGSGTDSTLTFEFWDNHGQTVWVSHSGTEWGWFEQNHNNVITFDSDRCIKPCQVIITTDGTGANAPWMMSYVDVVVTGGPAGVEHITFYNGTPGRDGDDGKWIGPGYDMYLTIDTCLVQHAAAPILQRNN